MNFREKTEKRLAKVVSDCWQSQKDFRNSLFLWKKI